MKSARNLKIIQFLQKQGRYRETGLENVSNSSQS